MRRLLALLLPLLARRLDPRAPPPGYAHERLPNGLSFRSWPTPPFRRRDPGLVPRRSANEEAKTRASRICSST